MRAMRLFAELLGIADRQAEDALSSEQAAKLVLSRRLFLGVSGAAVTTALLSGAPARSFAKPEPLSSVHLLRNGRIIGRWAPGQRILQYRANGNPLARGGPGEVIELRRLTKNGAGYPIAIAYADPRVSLLWQASYDGMIIA